MNIITSEETLISINSKIDIGASLPSFPQMEIKYEPMFFTASLDYAYKNGGRLTKQFIDKLDPFWVAEAKEDIIIDSRIHMLMEGWYPCIPGYHHDDVPRERSDKQPEYFNPSYRSEHAMALYNGDICPTQFAIGESNFPDVPIGHAYYKVWHPLVEQKILKGDLKRIEAPSDSIIYFDDRTWHQGFKAKKSGWRMFIRATKNTGRKPLNEIRKQVQVYLEFPMEGW